MHPFSRRNKLREEFSGIEEASPFLRNRLMEVIMQFVVGGNHFGIGNDDWIYVNDLHRDLKMNFGEAIVVQDILDKERLSHDGVFDIVELFARRADIDRITLEKRHDLTKQIKTSLELSGSVYDFNGDKIILRLDEETSHQLTSCSKILNPHTRARTIFLKASKKLVLRKGEPRDIIKDLYIALEKYLIKVTKTSNWNAATKSLKNKLHPLQIKTLNNLKDYRGDAGQVAHATDSSEPTASDALWYLRSVMTTTEIVNDKHKPIIAD